MLWVYALTAQCVVARTEHHQHHQQNSQNLILNSVLLS